MSSVLSYSSNVAFFSPACQKLHTNLPKQKTVLGHLNTKFNTETKSGSCETHSWVTSAG